MPDEQKRKRIHLRDVLNDQSRNDRIFSLKDIEFIPENVRDLRTYDSKGSSIDVSGKNPYTSYTTNLPKRSSLPFMKITEFQPDLFFKWSQHLKVIANTLSNTFSAMATFTSKGSKTIYQQFIKQIGDLAGTQSGIKNTQTKSTDATNDLIASFYIDDSTYNTDVFSKPLNLYRSFFNGKYVASYEIPYTEDTSYRIDGNSGWDFLSDSNIDLGSDFGNAIYKTLVNLNVVDLPIIPRWKFKNSQDNFQNVSTTFHLYNYNFDALVKNFKFLGKFMQGPMWVQYNARHIPPNVYTVEIPGITYMQYATIQIEVSEIGNKRKLASDADYTRFSNKVGYDLFKNTKDPKSIFFPDAWKIDVIVRSLVPNNFNTFMHYMLNGGDVNNVTVDTYIMDGGFKTESEYFKELDKKTTTLNGKAGYTEPIGNNYSETGGINT